MAERVLVDGGAGFLGSHLCERLLARGCEVLCLDNLITGTQENLQPLLANPRFRFLQHDITRPISVDGPLDAVWHMASPASPVDYGKYPIQTLKVGALGTHNILGLCKAKGASFLLASTSEVYGDPQVNPQPETYWGHVNPIGPRGVYDEAKRFAEAMTMAYHRVHGVKTHIARIFNSILADETVVLFNDTDLHVESIASYAERLRSRMSLDPPVILLPAFEPGSCRIVLKPASAVIKHPCHTDCYALSLRYGRTVKVTGDHSVFVRGPDGQPLAKPVRTLHIGDHVAIPARLPAVERDFQQVDLLGMLIRTLPSSELWEYAVEAPSIPALIKKHQPVITRTLLASGRFKAERLMNTVGCAIRKYRQSAILPLSVVRHLGLSTRLSGRIRVFKGGAHIWLPATIPVTNDLLWLLGFYIAEGTSHYQPGKSAFIGFSSDEYLLARAAEILSRLGCHVVRVGARPNRAPAVFVHSKLLYFLFQTVFGVIKTRRFPSWMLQLPLSRLKYVLEGYRQGDGTHSGKKDWPGIVF